VIVLQAGVPKSGNLWLYKIIQSAMEEVGHGHRSFITGHPIHAVARTWPLSYPEQADVDVLDFEHGRAFFRISSRFRQPVGDLDGYLARASHVWTHSEVQDADLPLLLRFDRIVYLLRDPRDVALSMARFAFTPYIRRHFPHGSPSPEAYLARHLAKLTKSWVRHVASYLLLAPRLRLHAVFYERLLADFDAEFDRLSGRLGWHLDRPARARIARAVQFAEMKKGRPDHLQAGRSGGWRTELDADQVAAVARIAAPMLELLGYPIDEQQAPDRLPALPESVPLDRLRAAADAARYTVTERLRDRAGQARSRLRRVLSLRATG
jgi:aryl sulfotransferase